MDKKFIWIAGGGLVLIVILIIVMIALGSQNKKPAETTLTFWSFTDEESAYDKAIESFQKDHPSVRVNFVQKDPKDYLADSLNEIAAGNGPDIWTVPNDWMAKYHDKMAPMPDNKLADNENKKSDTDVYKETFYPVVAQNNIIDNKIYGMPLTLETLTLYYNPGLLQDALTEYQKTATSAEAQNNYRLFTDGPANWDDFATLAEAVTKKSDSKITLSGAALGTAERINHSVDILTVMMLQNGAEMTNSNLTAAEFHTATNKFDGPAFPGSKALDFYTDFTNPKSPHYSWDDSLGDSIRAFAEGKAAMMIGYQSDKDEIKRITPNLSFSTINLPQVKETKNPVNYASYNTFTVTRTSKNSDLSWDLILALTSQENASQYQMDTNQTVILARKGDSNQDNPARTAQSWYKPDPDKANETFADMIRQVNVGTQAQTALDGAANQITALLLKLKQ